MENKHGKWVDRYNGKYANPLYVCSVCGKEALYDFYINELDQTKLRQALTPGCPHCLAIMDEKEENKICPFCGAKHTLKEYQNIFCPCGAKYYFYDKFWLNRKTKEEIKEWE